MVNDYNQTNHSSLWGALLNFHAVFLSFEFWEMLSPVLQGRHDNSYLEINEVFV